MNSLGLQSGHSLEINFLVTKNTKYFLLTQVFYASSIYKAQFLVVYNLIRL